MHTILSPSRTSIQSLSLLLSCSLPSPPIGPTPSPPIRYRSLPSFPSSSVIPPPYPSSPILSYCTLPLPSHSLFLCFLPLSPPISFVSCCYDEPPLPYIDVAYLLLSTLSRLGSSAVFHNLHDAHEVTLHFGSEGPPLATGSAPCRLALLVLVVAWLGAALYLADDCILASSDEFRRRLYSADVDTCIVPRTRTRFGDRSFSAAGPGIWNSLPPDLRRPDIELGEFRRLLKTFLFV